MRNLLIGGNGFIGSNLAIYLARRGEEVTVYHRASSSLENLASIPFHSEVGEIGDEARLNQCIAQSDVVFNLAACTSPLPRDEAQRQAINVDGAQRIARLARKRGVRLVHVSSIAAVGSPGRGQVADETLPFNRQHDPYGSSKYQADQLVLQEVSQGANIVIACPGNVVGGHAMKPTQKNNFVAISQGRMKLYPPGGVCLADVDDLVNGLYLCGQKGRSGQRYLLGGHNVLFKDYFEEIARATGGKAPQIPLPGFLLPVMGWGVEVVFGALGRVPPVNRDTGDVVSRKMYYTSQKACTELGYTIGDWREAIRKASRTAMGTPAR
ncbi:MAG: NAD-dependent epimerase/dehydratase family protein [Magnetococcales bacterium]|nr:NAD-dependent epimerase/dehydratase family protein [Magnetococcales bacterium]